MRAAGDAARETERWLRRVGLPWFVRPGARAEGLLERVSPFLVFALLAGVVVSGLVPLRIAIDVDSPSLAVLLGLLVLAGAAVVIAAPVAIALLLAAVLRRRPAVRRPAGIALVVLYVVVLPAVVWIAVSPGDGLTVLIADVVVTVVAVALTWLGIGSLLAWAARAALRQVTAIGALITRALPILMLVIVFAFFSRPVWEVTSTMSPGRLFAVAVFFALLGLFFVLPIGQSEMRELDGGTGDSAAPALSRVERINLQGVLVLSLGLQTVLFAVIVCVFLVVLGGLALSHEVLEEWVGDRLTSVTVLGVDVPFTWALLKTAIFLSCVSSLNFLVSVTTNAAYRSRFFHPLLDEAREALEVRAAYRGGEAPTSPLAAPPRTASTSPGAAARPARHAAPTTQSAAESEDELLPEMIEPGPGSAG